MHGLIRQETETRILGLECFGLARLDPQTLPGELAALPKPALLEARPRVDQIDEVKILERLGFSKVCCQVNYIWDLDQANPDLIPEGQAQTPLAKLELAPGRLAAHAANLRFSRFSLDARLPPGLWLTLHQRWVGHALASKSFYKFALGQDFVAFTLLPGRVFVALLSVLSPGLGRGRALLNLAGAFGRAKGLKCLEVCTEAENEGACQFYQHLGFKLEASFSILHWHHGRFEGDEKTDAPGGGASLA